MPKLLEINNFINSLLESDTYIDNSKNGLQVDCGQKDIKKIALSVDSGLSIIKQAIYEKADILICHHGLFWGEEQTITGSLGDKVRLLIENKCSLIAQHLPLDGNLEVGNNIELARLFELDTIERFCPHYDQFIGVRGIYKNPKRIDYFIEKGKNLIGFKNFLSLPFGKMEINKIAIVSGSGSSAIPYIDSNEIDLFISGEPKQSNYHHFKELQTNALFLGHYATETVGVRALGEKLKQKFGVESVFINEPTGI